MKILAAGFTTALLVFAVASALSEMLLTPEVSPSNGTVNRRRTRSVKDTDESVHSTREPSGSQRAETLPQDNSVKVTAELQRRSDVVRQRESAVQAKQDALQIIFDDIREEQRSVEFLRRRVSEEIAALRATAVRVALSEAPVPNDVSPAQFVSRPADRSAVFRPVISVRDPQAIRDSAVFVKRLVQLRDSQSAIALLQPLNDRDATKVLTALSETDSEMAVQLAQDLRAAREKISIRR